MRGRMNIPARGGGGGNNGCGGGSGSELYVYAQKNEPEGKDGLWIKTAATVELPEIDKFTLNGVDIVEYNTYTMLENIPYNACNCNLEVLGTDIYIYLVGTIQFHRIVRAKHMLGIIPLYM